MSTYLNSDRLVRGAIMTMSAIVAVFVVAVPASAERPYSRFYGGDLFAGGAALDSVTNTCSTKAVAAAGTITGTAATGYRGTGAEMAIFAMDEVKNFFSSSQVAGAGPAATTFANTTAIPLTFGGLYGQSRCDIRYWDTKPTTAPSPIMSLDVNSITSSGTYYFDNDTNVNQSVANSFSLPAGLLDDGERVTVYVDGNVLIGSDTYNAASNEVFGFRNTAWADRDDIPSFTLIATGNIYIGANVTRVDGIFISQTGGFHTCGGAVAGSAQNSNLVKPLLYPAEIEARCGKKLTINGAVLTNTMHFLRHVSDVSAAGPTDELPTSPTISEVFIHTPEIFLTQGAGLPRTPGNIRIQSLTALPPVF